MNDGIIGALSEYTTGIILKSHEARFPWGCDKCKRKIATQKFIGFLGNELYICKGCVEEMIR